MAGLGLRVKDGPPGESPDERKRTITNLGNTDTVTIRLRRNTGDVKTGFKNIKFARQQKEIIYFLCAFGHMGINGLEKLHQEKFG